MYFFDNQTLNQYLESGEKLQVFANKEYLTITSKSDISDTQYGAGIDVSGKTIPFSYKEIEHIKIGGFIYTMDQLQKSFDAPKPEEGDAAASGDTPPEDATKDVQSSDKQPAEPKAPQKPGNVEKKKDLKTDKTESIGINHYIKNNDPSSMYYGSSGPVQYISDGMVTYKTFVEGRYSNLTIQESLVESMEIVEGPKPAKLSAYTIASNCTDLSDVEVGIDELKYYISDCRKNGKIPNQTAYTRLSRLEDKRDKLKK